MIDPTENKGVAIIADDEESGRLLLAATAADAGLTPLVFENGAEALSAALSHDVSILLLDVDMPGMDGYGICRRLRTEPRFASVPIVMVTGHEDSTAIGLAFDAGATDFVSKPVNWALLPRRLAYILRNAAAAERIERLAFFDTLTGLPNRQRCVDSAEQCFADATLLGEGVAIIYMDLNGFKRVNDSFGHSVGDAVLQDVAAKLTASLARFRLLCNSLSVSRFGGDEFVIVLRHSNARAFAAEVSDACFQALETPIVHDGLEFYSAPSVGIALYPDDGNDVATVLKHADIAMYRAKSNATGSVVMYTAEMSTRQRDWLDVEGRLRRAVQNGLLQLHYQPKWRMRDNHLAGAEALLRWHDDEYGQIEPTRFIEIAEDSGLIIELGHSVIRAACQQLRKWQDNNVRLPIAINVSGKELLHGDPARLIEEEASDAGVCPSMIEVEITESLLVNDSITVRRALARMRDLGCQIALDDFGTGYSSLAYITRFPPDRIKIDKAFVCDLDRSASGAAVASAILSLARGLGIIVTAEGIERQSQFEWLMRRGCDEAQGFLLSHPLAVRDFESRFLFAKALDNVPVDDRIHRGRRAEG